MELTVEGRKITKARSACALGKTWASADNVIASPSPGDQDVRGRSAKRIRKLPGISPSPSQAE
jgi:hypothetical protein